jgi:hypothetical protein
MRCWSFIKFVSTARGILSNERYHEWWVVKIWKKVIVTYFKITVPKFAFRDWHKATRIPHDVSRWVVIRPTMKQVTYNNTHVTATPTDSGTAVSKVTQSLALNTVTDSKILWLPTCSVWTLEWPNYARGWKIKWQTLAHTYLPARQSQAAGREGFWRSFSEGSFTYDTRPLCA